MMKFLIGGIAAALVAAGPAVAADLAVKAPVYKAPPIAPAYNWTGFYIGGNVGYSWGRASTSAAVAGLAIPGSISQNMDGWLGGGQLGYNWQNGSWVFGLEGDIQGTGQRGTFGFGGTVCPGVAILALPCQTGTLSDQQKLPWFATLRGRLGVTPVDRALLYVTGGLAVGEVDTNASLTDTVAFPGAAPIAVVSAAESANTTRTGWTIGAGAEWAIAGQWTAKAEYLYVDLGTLSTAFVGPAGIFTGVTTSSHVTDNIFRVGVNYRFGGPVVARY